ncbi:hypothetical protein FHG87_022298 [Trinorchestia longiramus]|nr:hypothetical protein FHG87_022298 [Trinorchestia longiramus]
MSCTTLHSPVLTFIHLYLPVLTCNCVCDHQLGRLLSLTYERSRSGSSAQSTALYNEATTLGNTDSLPSASKVNISTKNSHHLSNSTHSQQQSKGSRNQPSCLRTGWGSNNPRANKCTCSNHTSQHPAGNTRASKKDKATTNIIFKCLYTSC